MLVFVYGSLKRGFSNHAFLAGQRFLGDAVTRPGFRVFNCGGFPGAVPDRTGTGYRIHGELWEIDPPGLTRLDWLEDVGSGLYRHGKCELERPADTREDVRIYLYNRPLAGLMETGPFWGQSLDTGPPSAVPPPEPPPTQE